MEAILLKTNTLSPKKERYLSHNLIYVVVGVFFPIRQYDNISNEDFLSTYYMPGISLSI